MKSIYDMITKDIIFFDIETTGTDVKDDRIVEICAIKYRTNRTKVSYHTYIKPDVPMSKGAEEVHGLSMEFLSNYPTMSENVEDLYNFFKGCDLGGYNCLKFDIPFLFEELARHGKYLDMSMNIIDSYNILNKLEPRKLNDVYKRYFGNDIDNSHSAESDIDATIKVFEKQVESYNLSEHTMSDISNIVRTTQDGDRMIDLSGWFKLKDGDFYYCRGMHKDVKVLDNMDYLKWMIGSNKIEINSRIAAKRILDRYESKNKV